MPRDTFDHMGRNAGALQVCHAVGFAQHLEEDDADVHLLCHELIGPQVFHPVSGAVATLSGSGTVRRDAAACALLLAQRR